MSTAFDARLRRLLARQEKHLRRKNRIDLNWSNGLFDRYAHPVVDRQRIPLYWRYDLNEKTNPYLMERLAVNVVFNPGAIEHDGKMVLVCRVEAADRKSFFALAESRSPVEGFTFRPYPVDLPEDAQNPETNVYDMRLTAHEDGWIYGLFCAERKDPAAGAGDLSSAVAACGICRTRDLVKWQRLSDLKTASAQQRNVVLHPAFIDGQYALYTRPQDNFIEAGSGGGIGWALCQSMDNAAIDQEKTIDLRAYHTLKESKNGQGPPPIETEKGWLHIAHGVRNTAAGLRYTLYAMLSDLDEPWRITHRPGGYLIAPEGEERVGDVSNVVFCNGAVARRNGDLFIYYASSDTRIHVAATTIDKMLDYVLHTPPDGQRSRGTMEQRMDLISRNLTLIEKSGKALLKRAKK